MNIAMVIFFLCFYFKLFSKCGKLRNVTVSRKKDMKNPGEFFKSFHARLDVIMYHLGFCLAKNTTYFVTTYSMDIIVLAGLFADLGESL